jgi:ATP/maltotriose-dependent transcriptional regulator MalT
VVFIVAALRTIAAPFAANIGEEAIRLLESPQRPPTEAILTVLLNEITNVPDHLVLVLDDYHSIDSKPIDNALNFLLDHLPPQMHLVIASREDPDLALARLRTRGQLTELRVSNLRFAPSEADRFLNAMMGLHLSAEDIAALEARTEGWIAGLQLAALSMQGQQDPSGFIKSFTGSHHFVTDYLVQEVLQRQPENIRTFLLRTSILDRLCGALCDAVLADGSTSGQETLEYLQRANLLVVPLDDVREWYRYHHLFADVLRARLMQEQPERITVLHRRASAWYEQNNFRADAIHHALAARDFERAADLIELERSVNLKRTFQSPTGFGWVKAMPYEFVRTRPKLIVGYVWELLFLGELEAAGTRMEDAELLLEPAADMNDSSRTLSAMAGVSQEEIQSLRASVAIARAFHSQVFGDRDGAVKYARRALTLVPDSDRYKRGQASALLGLARLRGGDLETAYQYMANTLASVRIVGNIHAANSATYVLAEIRIAQGRLLDAITLYEQALRLTTAQGEQVPQGAADLYSGLSGLYDDLSYLREFQHITLARLIIASYKRDRADRPMDDAFSAPNKTAAQVGEKAEWLRAMGSSRRSA